MSLSHSLKLSLFLISDNGSDFCDQNAEESEDTVGCAEEEIELDVPAKNTRLA